MVSMFLGFAKGQIWGLTAGRGVFSKSLLECLLHRESLLIVLEGLLVLP